MTLSQEDLDACADALQEARAYVMLKGPYYSRLLYGLIPTVAEGLGTIGVTKGLVLVIDPIWFAEKSVEERGSLLVHELNHVMRGISRLEAMPDLALANVAFDLAINNDLRNAGWTLPKGGLYPDTFGFKEGLTGEEYYELLCEDTNRTNDTLNKALQHGDGEEGGGEEGGGEEGAGTEGEEGECAGDDWRSRAATGSGKCGSCAGNAVDAEAEEEADAKDGRSADDVTHIINQAESELREAAEKSSGRGSLPQHLIDFLDFSEEDKKHPVDWRSRTSHIIRKCTGAMVSGKSDYSLRRPSKRSCARGFPRPGMVAHKPVIAFVEDTSGSMGPAQLLESRIQACDVCTQLGIDTAWWISADAGVSEPPKRVRIRDIKSMPVVGRGGTDFRPAIALAQKLRPKVDLLIYNTDGDGPAPEFAPVGMEVVWCIVPSSWGCVRPAPWGHMVVVSEDQEVWDRFE